MTALGAFFDSYLLMEISRFVFGIGGESLAVAQNTYASAWFRGKALNAVFGLQLSIARLGFNSKLPSLWANFQCDIGMARGQSKRCSRMDSVDYWNKHNTVRCCCCHFGISGQEKIHFDWVILGGTTQSCLEGGA